MPRFRRTYNPFLYLTAIQSIINYSAVETKSLVTLGLIAANVAIFYRIGPLDDFLPDLSFVCLNSRQFLKHWNWGRFLLSPFYHGDEVHLIYNMISLLWKGHELEGRLGPQKFATTVGALLLLSQGIHVALSKFLATYTYWTSPFRSECAVGFSSVLFAIKTILNAREYSVSNVHGIRVPTKYATWVELLLIHFLVYNSSFVGHLSGILAGIIFLKLDSILRAAGKLIRATARIFRHIWVRSEPSGGRRNSARVASQPRHQEPGSGHSQEVGSIEPWSCSRCTFVNGPGSATCEVCNAPASLQVSAFVEDLPSGRAFEDYVPTGSSDVGFEHPSNEELRRRRLSRFEN